MITWQYHRGLWALAGGLVFLAALGMAGGLWVGGDNALASLNPDFLKVPSEGPQPPLKLDLDSPWQTSLDQRQLLAWPLVSEMARNHGLPPALVMAVIQVESTFRPWAESPRGAAGLMQIHPDTAQELGLNDPFDPADNIRAGVGYLATLTKRFSGDLRLALAAYNAGPSKVEACGDVPPIAETRAYVERVMSEREHFRSRFGLLARNEVASEPGLAMEDHD